MVNQKNKEVFVHQVSIKWGICFEVCRTSTKVKELTSTWLEGQRHMDYLYHLPFQNQTGQQTLPYKNIVYHLEASCQRHRHKTSLWDMEEGRAGRGPSASLWLIIP